LRRNCFEKELLLRHMPFVRRVFRDAKFVRDISTGM